MPASLIKLEQAVKRAYAAHAAAERAHHDAQRTAEQEPTGEPSADERAGEEVEDGDLDELDSDAV